MPINILSSADNIKISRKVIQQIIKSTQKKEIAKADNTLKKKMLR